MTDRTQVRKDQELYIRGKRYKVLGPNEFGSKYRYIVQDQSSGRVTLIDRDVALEALQVQKIRMERGEPPMPRKRNRLTNREKAEAAHAA